MVLEGVPSWKEGMLAWALYRLAQLAQAADLKSPGASCGWGARGPGPWVGPYRQAGTTSGRWGPRSSIGAIDPPQPAGRSTKTASEGTPLGRHNLKEAHWGTRAWGYRPDTLNSDFRHFEGAAEGHRDHIRIPHEIWVSLVTCLHRIRTVGPCEQAWGMGCSRGPLGHPRMRLVGAFLEDRRR